MAKTKPDSKKKSGPDAVIAAAMKRKAAAAAPKSNPFETIWSRRKFTILGKKRKGEERRLALSCSNAIEKRNDTLLKEYLQSSKASLFVDKRIEKQDHSLGEFEKAIMRSQKLMLSRKGKNNLSNGEDEELEITGLGPYSDRDAIDEEIMADERDEKFSELRDLNASDVEDGEKMQGEENRHKSKKEIMKEVMLKSKLFKAQKAEVKEENELLKDELNDKFSSLVAKGIIDGLNSRSNESGKKDEPPVTQKMGRPKLEQPDSYDKFVSEMVLECRARPSDRTKTPEEVAQEEMEQLKDLEEARQKKMLATEDSSEEDNEDVDKSPMQRPRPISGDDLGDSFSLGEEPKAKRGWVDEILERENADDFESEGDGSSEYDSDDGESDEDNDDKTSIRDWEQIDDAILTQI